MQLNENLIQKKRKIKIENLKMESTINFIFFINMEKLEVQAKKIKWN